jgi:hypothetical protein
MTDTKKPKRRAAGKKADARETINVTALIDALEQHVLGNKEMTSTQVSAALALLKKILPDMAEPKRAPAPDENTPLAHEDALSGLE